LIVDAVPQSQTGVASGMNANIRTVGGALGSAVVASVITANARPDGLPTEAGYSHGFALLVVTSALATLVAVGVPVVKAATRVVRGQQAVYEMEPPVGIEPTTYSLRVNRSTD
jgi:sugar phosphate permease